MKEDNTSSTNTNWLGLPLSSHITMDANNSAPQPLPSSQTFYLPSSAVSENGDFLSPLSIMPLKSDGSLCIMDAHSRSHHSQGYLSPPPLPLCYVSLSLSLSQEAIFTCRFCSKTGGFLRSCNNVEPSSVFY